MLNWFRPQSYASRITAIDLTALRARGVRGVIIDLDNTIVGFRQRAPLADDALWVRAATAADVRVVVLTNNGTPWAAEIARDLGVPCIAKARKPLPGGFRRALRVLDVRADEAVVIGDQLFTDVLGARLARVEVILVEPLVRHDPWNTKPLRWIERLIMRGVPRA
jgi:HAD superfamily phosphatase (TIGR01668 family)